MTQKRENLGLEVYKTNKILAFLKKYSSDSDCLCALT